MTNPSFTNQIPMVSPAANRAVIRRRGDDMVIEAVPRWLVSLLGLDGTVPIVIDSRTTDSHPLRSLAWVTHDVLLSRQPLKDFLFEFSINAADPIFILANGQIAQTGDGEYVELTLRDVSEIIAESRKAAAIGNYHGLVGQSLRMLEVFYRIALYGPTVASVLITGETGTGKELVARALHERSKRANGPFVPVNCTALTPELFESELFGHEKGSFTGATRQHRGRFERADGGTLFLDELGDMPLVTQAKMLRALEEGIIERVGSEKEEEVDVRTVAATNVTLERAVASGRFRADLYHRLSVFRIHMPPLRERLGDIPLLVDSFLEGFNKRYEKNIKRLTPEAMRMLEEYSWPGNVRELRNVIERLVVEASGEAIGGRALGAWIAEREYLMPGDWNTYAPVQPSPPVMMPTPGYAAPPSAQPAYPQIPFPSLPYSGESIEVESARLDAAEEPEDVELTVETIREAFQSEKGNLTGAARALGVHKATLYRHMKRLGLTREDLEDGLSDA